MTDHVVMYSGGKASWLAALRVKERFGDDLNNNITLLFTDTKTEDADLYRFLREGAEKLELSLVEIADGRDIWQVFKDRRFLGTNRVPLCSRILKQEPSETWVRENCDPETSVMHFGIDWTEIHRCDRIAKHWDPIEVDFPLLWEPMADKSDVDEHLAAANIEPPRLYALGAPHNNCGGMCVRAGKAHFKWAIKAIPEVYDEWADKEEEVRTHLNSNIAILRDTASRGGQPVTLKRFKERVEAAGTQLDLFDEDDWGGCGCMSDYE